MRATSSTQRWTVVLLLAINACSHSRQALTPARPGVHGRVLWNEQPVRGAHVYATSEYNFQSTHYGDATTDADGRFFIPGVPLGRKYLYVFGNGADYWVSAVTPFDMPAIGDAAAPETYVCRGFEATAPARGEVLHTAKPLLRWNPYPDAVDYAVRVIKSGERDFIFSRGDRDPRLATTSAQIDVDLRPGEYNWRVDAFNGRGHIIGCSRYPRPFVVAE